MHVAIDARIINSTTGTYVERLISNLEKIDTTNRYSILVRAKDKDFWIPSNPNFSVIVADFANYSFAEQFTFKRFLDKLSPDLVHFCMPQQPVGYKGVHVTTVHDLTLFNTYNSDKNWLVYHAKQFVGRYVFKKIGKTSAVIITPSKYTKSEYIEFASIPEEKVSVTYEAADTVIGSLKEYKHPFKQYLLYVGQQSDYKNIKRLGDAHQKLLSSHPELGLILVGKLNPAALKNQHYFQSKNYQNILFTDFLPDAQRDWLYSHATAYVFPSLMEGFGLPGLEAMGYGAPVISSNATCLPEVYGKAAVYFDPTNTNDMANAIETVISDETIRVELVKKGYEQLKKYSWKRMAEQTHVVYLEVTK